MSVWRDVQFTLRRKPTSSTFIRRYLMTGPNSCIAGSLDPTCGPAEYEWLYTEPEMNRPGGEDWIPLCEECCAYWRAHAAGKPYRVRTLRNEQQVV